MVDETHLRDLASRCLWLSKNCYDLTAAAELRRISTEMTAAAADSRCRTDARPGRIESASIPLVTVPDQVGDGNEPITL